MVNLGIRLQAVADMVEQGSVVADIGCDHALVCIALVERGICPKCYACDVAEGPLSRARQAISQAGLQDQIIPVLQDGIAALAADVDTVIIAGMGFETIRAILLEGRPQWARCRSLIIASHTDVEELRRFLSEEGFVIDTERIVRERHYYQIIKTHHDAAAPRLSETQIMFGCHRDDDPLFIEYWTHELNKCRDILHQMPEGHARRSALLQRQERIQCRLYQKDALSEG